MHPGFRGLPESEWVSTLGDRQGIFFPSHLDLDIRDSEMAENRFFGGLSYSDG